MNLKQPKWTREAKNLIEELRAALLLESKAEYQQAIYCAAYRAGWTAGAAAFKARIQSNFKDTVLEGAADAWPLPEPDGGEVQA